MGDDFVNGEKTTVEYQKTLFATEEYVDNAVNSYYGLPTAMHLGAYAYARSNDSASAGYVRSNTSTNPANITQLNIHKTNNNSITWPIAFLNNGIKEKMYLSLHKTNSDYFQGRITAVDTSNSNYITVTLNHTKSAGVFQLGQGVDVYLSYNKSEGRVATL